ncbi:MAG: SRPBCC domain-containing protein, partial [Flavobacterium sp.]|nr:SRPBCC domain-containing protein [Flavobacterium sp.]
DVVNARDEFFTFSWNGSEENARLSLKKNDERVKFKWIDEHKKDTEYFFEILIMEDEITKDVSINVIDFAEEDEIDEMKQLWTNQISDLKHIIGSV